MADGIAIFHNSMEVIMFFYCLVTMILGTTLCIIGAGILNDNNRLFHELLEAAKTESDKWISVIPPILPEAYTTLQFPVYDVLVLARNISISLTLLGMFFIGTSVAGFFLSRRSKMLPILAYTIYMVVLTAAMIALFSSGRNFVVKDMKWSLQDYKGLADGSSKGRTWNMMMAGLGCCGVESYKDFENLANWPPADLENYTVDKEEFQKYPEYSDNIGCSEDDDRVSCQWFDSNYFLTPMACCKNMNNIPDGCHVKAEVNQTKNATDNWMDVGCSTKIFEYISQKTWIGGLFIAMLIFTISFCIMLISRLVLGEDDLGAETSTSYKYGSQSASESGDETETSVSYAGSEGSEVEDESV